MYLNTPAFCVEEVSSSVRMMTRDGGIQVERMMCHVPEYSSILCGGGEQLCEDDDDKRWRDTGRKNDVSYT